MGSVLIHLGPFCPAIFQRRPHESSSPGLRSQDQPDGGYLGGWNGNGIVVHHYCSAWIYSWDPCELETVTLRKDSFILFPVPIVG